MILVLTAVPDQGHCCIRTHQGPACALGQGERAAGAGKPEGCDAKLSATWRPLPLDQVRSAPQRTRSTPGVGWVNTGDLPMLMLPFVVPKRI